MIFLLDTNAVVAIGRKNLSVLERQVGFEAADFGVSFIVAYEVAFGAFRSTQLQSNLTELARLRLRLSHLTPLMPMLPAGSGPN